MGGKWDLQGNYIGLAWDLGFSIFFNENSTNFTCLYKRKFVFLQAQSLIYNIYDYG